MKIWYHPQISMRSRREDRLILEHDAQWTKVKEVLIWLDNAGHDITVIFPSRMRILDEFFVDHNIDILIAGGCGNVMVNRYHFDSEQMIDLLSIETPDVIWLEVPELVTNYRSICDIPIVATFEHFVDQYIWRQFEGFIDADICIVPTQELFMKFQRMFCGRIDFEYRHDIFSNADVRFWGNFIAATDITRNKEIIEHKWDDAVVEKVIFPSRLTDYERTKWANFIECVRGILCEGYDVEICNPSEVEKPELVSRLEGEDHRGDLIFHETKMNREEWLHSIAKAHVAFMLYSFDDFYSVGAIELLAAGVKLITPYSSFLDCNVDAQDQLYFINDVDKDTILEVFSNAILEPMKSFDCDDFLNKVSGEAWAPEILNTLEEASSIQK